MKTITTPLLTRIKQQAAHIIPEEALAQKLASKKKLRVKLGLDPTAPDLHLGHAIVLKLLREFSDAGHEVIFLVGDFTARIGDPAGRSKTRPPLSTADIARNMQTYLAQISRILDPQRISIRYNSEWLDKLSAQEMVKLCAQVTVARIIEREDFAQRLTAKTPIGFHELLYPLFQGYDSVALEADIELGGTDQTFNVLMGRFLQEQYGQEPQVVITLPLLRGLDGEQKMSKSLNNAIGIAEPADQAYGKLMSISDALMWHYYELLLGLAAADIAKRKDDVANGRVHPMQAKKDMARAVVAAFWSSEQADEAYKNFEAVFQNKDYSQAQSITLPAGTQSPLWIVDLLKILKAVTTSSEAKRLITDGAVVVDSEHVRDFNAQISWRTGMQVKVGKHRIYTLR